MTISKPERNILRSLAGEVAEMAAHPSEDFKRQLWYRHNALVATRPLIFCDPENGWNEIIPPERLVCQGELARQWEWRLRKEIFWGKEMGDDRVIEPFFYIGHVHPDLDWGLSETKIGGSDGGAYRWEAPVKTETDLERLHYPKVKIDFQEINRQVDLAEETFGDQLKVRVKNTWWWTVGMTRTLANMRGLEQIMYDMLDAPGLIHRLMAFLRDGMIALLSTLEQENLLCLNNDGTYVGSGGFGWTHELPAVDFQGHVRLCDMWGFAESQETVGISPGMFAEFVFPYQLSVLERFGLNCYGCCEPLDARWEVVSSIPRLRRVSVSPWSNHAHMAELLGDRFIYSMKPSPTDLAMPSFDEERIRSELRRALQITRHCRVEVIMKDNHTICHDPRRVTRWVEIAREEAESVQG